MASALWAFAGLRLAQHRASIFLGVLMLVGLGLKLAAETTFHASFLVPVEGWPSLPAARLWGTLLGLIFSLPLGFPPPPRMNRPPRILDRIGVGGALPGPAH